MVTLTSAGLEGFFEKVGEQGPSATRPASNGCPTWIRTMTRRVKVACAAITPSGTELWKGHAATCVVAVKAGNRTGKRVNQTLTKPSVVLLAVTRTREDARYPCGVFRTCGSTRSRSQLRSWFESKLHATQAGRVRTQARLDNFRGRLLQQHVLHRTPGRNHRQNVFGVGHDDVGR